MSEGPDLTHFVQHRELDVYAQRMSRQGYAYGVDLRRSSWLSTSTVGNALVRAVDRAWPQLSAHLMDEAFTEGRDISAGLLHELVDHMNVLRSPLPTVRALRRHQRGNWPIVTALGATRGGSLWLILDTEALSALDAPRRAFLLGSGLGHLHCDHAVFFTAHLLANRREGSAGIRALQSALIPWTKLMLYSADRAGLIACGNLEAALSVVEAPPVAVGEGSGQAARIPRWMPPAPSTSLRVSALEEFAKSAAFARVVAARARKRELARQLGGFAPPEGQSSGESEAIHVPADAWSLARVDARLTDRLNLL